MYNYNGYPQYGQYGQSFQQPSYNVPSVINKQAAMAYNMPANSSTLLLEEQSDHVFLVQTDSAGVKQITTYQLVPYKEPEPVTVDALSERIANLESMLQKALGGVSNGQSNPAANPQ